METANFYYVSKLDANQRQAIFVNVVDFFNETWKHKPKPFKYNKYIAKKKKLTNENAEEIRDTSIQKTILIDKNGKVTFNKRKLTELPNFISKLTPNLALPLACDNIYFDYDFLFGMFSCIPLYEIMLQLSQLDTITANDLSSEAQSAQEQLKLMHLILLKCGFDIKDRPESTGVQIASSAMMFFKNLNYFTRLIDDIDSKSCFNCALTAPYQIMPAPGEKLLFAFEKHTKPIVSGAIGGENNFLWFTLSDKLIVFDLDQLTNLAIVELEKTEHVFRHLLVYSNESIRGNIKLLKDLNGGFLVASDNEVLSYSFELNLLVKKKINNGDTIKNIFLISQFHFVISYQNRNYFDVINILNGHSVERRTFQKEIHFLEVNSDEMYFNNTNEFNSSKPIFIAVVFESAEIFIMKVDLDDLKLSLESILEIPQAGCDCFSIRFDKTYFNLIVTLVDGSILVFPRNLFYTRAANKNLIMIKPKVDNLKLIIKDDRLDCWGFIGSDGQAYYYADKLMFMIPGNFDDLIITDSREISTFENGTIKKYAFKTVNDNQTEYELSKIFEIKAHYEKISFKFINRGFGNLILTASYDSIMKCFLVQGESVFDDLNVDLDFDTNEANVKELVFIDRNDIIVSLLENSK